MSDLIFSVHAVQEVGACSFLDYLPYPCTIPNAVSTAIYCYHLIELRVRYCTGIKKYMLECDITKKISYILKFYF